jgi:excisionase family DNA binding protein
VSDLARVLLEELAGDPVALERLRELVGASARSFFEDRRAPAYTPRTLAVELGRSERSIRAAIARGELEAIKRGRGWVIAADAVAAWARGKPGMSQRADSSRSRRRTSGPGPMRRGLSRM